MARVASSIPDNRMAPTARRFTLLALILVALVFVLIVALATRVLFLETSAILAEHAEIVIRKLQVIFGLDPVAGKLRVARHALVFLE